MSMSITPRKDKVKQMVVGLSQLRCTSCKRFRLNRTEYGFMEKGMATVAKMTCKCGQVDTALVTLEAMPRHNRKP